MAMRSRRDFIKTGSITLLCSSAFFQTKQLAAEFNQTAGNLDLPLGLELYSIREMLPTNYKVPLRQIAALGYREVEAVGWANFYNHSASQVRCAVENAGLDCVSAHYSYDQLHTQLDQVLASNRDLGASYIVCSSPVFKDPSLRKMNYRDQPPLFTLKDWQWNAEQFNEIGEKVNAAGMKLSYHNHTMEFKKQNGVVPYDELLRLTDPSKVEMQLDCGWAVIGGGDPVELLRRYPTRISMLHVKDFKRTNTPVSVIHPPHLAELGQGSIDYRLIFHEAAKAGYVKHCFVEQEDSDIPIMQSLKVDAEYIRKLST